MCITECVILVDKTPNTVSLNNPQIPSATKNAPTMMISVLVAGLEGLELAVDRRLGRFHLRFAGEGSSRLRAKPSAACR